MTIRSRERRPHATFFALAWLWTSLVTTGCGGAGEVVPLKAERPEAQEFLQAHNRIRAGIEPRSAAPIPPLVWSDALARDAARVAADCSLDHSPTDHGENLAAAAPTLSPAEAVAIWSDERADWDATTNRCRPGRICGHFTQLVWRETRELGCASRRCEGGGPGVRGPWVVAVCQYSPGGNRRGVPPY